MSSSRLRYWPMSKTKKLPSSARIRPMRASLRLFISQRLQGAKALAQAKTGQQSSLGAVGQLAEHPRTIGQRRRAMGRPLAVEVGEKSSVVVVQRQRFDKQAVTLATVKGRRVWRGGDATEQAIAAAGKVRQSGRAVIDQRTVLKVQGHRRAGMAGGKHLHPVGGKPGVQLLLALRLAERFPRAAPASQGLLVAMANRHALAGHADYRGARPRGQAFGYTGQTLHGFIQLKLDGIGTLDLRFIHWHRVGAAAAGTAVVGTTEFGFDIAAQGQMGADALLNLLENLRVAVKPVCVAVKHHTRLGFGG